MVQRAGVESTGHYTGTRAFNGSYRSTDRATSGNVHPQLCVHEATASYSSHYGDCRDRILPPWSAGRPACMALLHITGCNSCKQVHAGVCLGGASWAARMLTHEGARQQSSGCCDSTCATLYASWL